MICARIAHFVRCADAALIPPIVGPTTFPYDIPALTNHIEGDKAVKFDLVEPGVYPELVYPSYKSTVKRGPSQPMLRI